jgi:hypothetical protein
MSPSKKKDVALACYAMVSNFFAMMHNPKFRGPNFEWENFPDMMAEHCKVQIFIYLKRCNAEIESYAEECGREIAVRLVSKLG